ncbi:putative Ribose-phosphate pyrophosphokinase 4 [Paratrimastix pyriformis]|uniref:Ribose-phosphate pyrophosphokinase 4 n=1 Tax=Paratrimastix pyriformis TaxID=342808 RepID=A0ABQ8UP33_9EUKA|nr:putative Ribose-phosphate pyrophosphokinase 4 [Paratrimastix pyriformis]
MATQPATQSTVLPSPPGVVSLRPVASERRCELLVYTYPSARPLFDALMRTHAGSSTIPTREAKCDWGEFETGWPNIHFEAGDSIYGRHAVFLTSFYKPTNIFQQISLAIALPRNHVKSLTVVVPFFGPGTMERVEEEGVLASAETMAKMLSAPMPLTSSGPTTIIIYDIHALQERFYFTDNVRVLLVSAIPTLMSYIKQDGRKTVLVFPDDGAAKRFGKRVTLPYLVCGKVRERDERFIRILDGNNIGLDTSKLRLRATDPDVGSIFTEEDRDAQFLIVDDLCNSGATLVRCAEALRLNGARRINAYCTHAVFGNDSWRKFTEGGQWHDVFDRFIVTNTIVETTEKLKGTAPFVVLDITPDLWNHLTCMVDSYEGNATTH